MFFNGLNGGEKLRAVKTEEEEAIGCHKFHGVP